MGFTIKMIAFLNLGLEFRECTKELALLIKDKNNNSYFSSIKRLFQLTYRTVLSVSNSESNNSEQIMILNWKKYSLLLALGLGASIEMLSVVSKPFQKGLLDNNHLLILGLRSLVAIFTLTAVHCSISGPLGFAKYATLSSEERKELLNNYGLLVTAVVSYPLGTMKHFCSPMKPRISNGRNKILEIDDNANNK